MKKRKNYSRAKQLFFKPEINLCPHCNHQLKKSHITWHKNIFTLKQTLHVTSYAYKCKNKNCPNPKQTYKSTEAEMFSLKYYQYGIDIITKIGHLYYQNHQTIDQIKQTLTTQHQHLQISRSEINLLYQAYLALTKADKQQNPPPKQNTPKRRHHPCIRRRPTRKRQPNTMDTKRPTNLNSTFSKKPRHSRQRQHRHTTKRNQNPKHQSKRNN